MTAKTLPRSKEMSYTHVVLNILAYRLLKDNIFLSIEDKTHG